MEIVFKNMMETLVLQKIEDMKDKLDCCTCEQCQMDIAAYALNHLPPQYVATRKGELFTKLDALSAQHKSDVIAAVTQAAVIVRGRPRHQQ